MRKKKNNNINSTSISPFSLLFIFSSIASQLPMSGPGSAAKDSLQRFHTRLKPTFWTIVGQTQDAHSRPLRGKKTSNSNKKKLPSLLWARGWTLHHFLALSLSLSRSLSLFFFFFFFSKRGIRDLEMTMLARTIRTILSSWSSQCRTRRRLG